MDLSCVHCHLSRPGELIENADTGNEELHCFWCLGLMDGDVSSAAVEKDRPEFPDTCRLCGGLIGWISSPTGGWWAHDSHPQDEHDAVPVGDENGCYTLPNGDCVGACQLHHMRFTPIENLYFDPEMRKEMD